MAIFQLSEDVVLSPFKFKKFWSARCYPSNNSRFKFLTNKEIILYTLKF